MNAIWNFSTAFDVSQSNTTNGEGTSRTYIMFLPWQRAQALLTISPPNARLPL
jgi:hypothetical protein